MSRIMAALAASALLASTPMARAICIQSYNIENTEIKNDSTILFHMRDGTTYENDLPQRCVGLKLAPNGFTYAPTNPGTDEICDNLDQFRVNDGTGTGQICLFGAFKKV